MEYICRIKFYSRDSGNIFDMNERMLTCAQLKAKGFMDDDFEGESSNRCTSFFLFPYKFYKYVVCKPLCCIMYPCRRMICPRSRSNDDEI